jgi:uncharacterized protein YndB with AHSA1/START domain
MTNQNRTTQTLVIERELPHRPEKVWRALTEGQLIKKWLMDNDFEPVSGHKFQFRSTPVEGWDGIIESEVLLVEPEKQLSYSWSSMGLETVVVWKLSATEGGTLLRMEQSGFASDTDRAYKGATYGWQKFIGELDQVVADLD